jgi:tetratricopeptide (TPR) repeat protein
MPDRPTFELVLTGGPTDRQFTAFVPDGQGGRAAEQAFEWRTDSTALAMDLGALAGAALSGRPPEGDLHRRFGQMLFQTVFAGAVGELWQARLAALRPRRAPLRLVIRPDPATARPLLNLPWEYLHDGHDFLALNWRTPLSRLAWNLPAQPLEPLAEPLRLLVLIAAPLGLGQDQVLNTAREEDIILGATAAARRAGRLEVEFAPGGSPEALETALREFDPHMLHFVGHGVFVEALDSGLLLMETADGHERQVPNAEFAALLERRAHALRFVFLSACQSAVAPRNDGYADLAPRLLESGVAGVVAMQFSVLNRSAMDFGGAFYQGIAGGDPLDAALVEARGRLAREGLNTVDFATPVLFVSDPGCLRVDEAALRPARAPAPLDLTGAAAAQAFVGRSAELRELQTNLDPERGRWRAAVVHGLGGMGKTVLAARLAERMAARLDGAKAIRMTPTTTAQAVLDQMGAFLSANNARLNCALVPAFVQAKDAALPLESKAAALIEILQARRLLLILDNYEDVLPEGQAVSRAAADLTPSPSPERGGERVAPASDSPPLAGEGPGVRARPGIDPDLARLVEMLVAGTPGPSRLLFTSRVDFSPLEAGRLADAVGHLGLGEMGFRDAVYLMETLAPLDRLPVAVLAEARPNPDAPPAPPALSMRDLYERLGGHPYTLNLFAEHARRSSAAAVLAGLAGVQRELLEFTLLGRAAALLPERAALLLRRAAIYDEPVPAEGLAFMLGDERDAMSPVAAEVEALLGWGLLARVPGTADYAVHSLVRDWARGQAGAEERLALLRRAAGFWYDTGNESHNLADYLRARAYWFLAGDYDRAFEIVAAATEPLFRWGQMELLLGLLMDSVRTLAGERRAVALGDLGNVYQALGDYAAARRAYEQVLAEFQALGDRRYAAAVYHQLGVLHQRQGEYGPARDRYQQALAIFQELGMRAEMANSLHQLGVLHRRQGEYGPARERTQQALAIFQELGMRAEMARSLWHLGMLHQAQGEYGPAREHYQQALAILQELGDRAGMAGNLHQLGVLHELQGEYGPARERYQQSLAIKQELGDRAGMASSLGQLGVLLQLQGEYRQAREFQERSLAIRQEIGDRSGVSICLHQLGMLHQLQGEYGLAHERYQQSLAIFQELGDRRNVAAVYHQLGTLHQAQGDYAPARERYQQSLAISQELGDRAGMAASLHQLGMLHQLQGEYGPARERYQQALAIVQELGNQAGIATSLGQIGLLDEKEGRLAQATVALAQALALFEKLGAPQHGQARRDLAHLREKMGEEAFRAALGEAGVAASPGEADEAGQGVTREQALQAVVANTVAVLTQVPGKKGEWWQALGQLQSQAKEQDAPNFAAFLGVLRQLVEGTAPEGLAGSVPVEYREAWEAVLRGIGRM